MSWCSKWLHGSEWPEGVEVTLGHDGNVRRYVPEAENAKLREERDMYRDLVDCMVHPDVPDQLYAENAKLQDENARLRSCLSDDAENARMIMAENVKLRELVGDMCEWAYVDSQCDLQGEFADRIRELGVEVGDA